MAYMIFQSLMLVGKYLMMVGKEPGVEEEYLRED